MLCKLRGWLVAQSPGTGGEAGSGPGEGRAETVTVSLGGRWIVEGGPSEWQVAGKVVCRRGDQAGGGLEREGKVWTATKDAG